MRPIDAVVVHYSSVPVLVDCLQALQPAPLASLTVVDNDPQQRVPVELAARFGVRLVRSHQNVGFARGVNAGVRGGRNPLVLLVNPDITVSVATLTALAETLDDADAETIAAVAPRLVLPDGRFQVGSAGCFPSLASVTAHCFPVTRWRPTGAHSRPLFLPSEVGLHHSTRSRVVDWVSAACLLVKRQAWDAVRGFDERFFLYGEDLDLCYRLFQHGWRVRYCPGVSAVHAQATRGTAWIDGLDQYHRLHQPRLRRVLHLILALGMSARGSASLLGFGDPHGPDDRPARRFAEYAWRAARLAVGS